MGHSSGAAPDQYGKGHALKLLQAALDSMVTPGLPVDALLAAKKRLRKPRFVGRASAPAAAFNGPTPDEARRRLEAQLFLPPSLRSDAMRGRDTHPASTRRRSRAGP
jgi:hypothetical protein